MGRGGMVGCDWQRMGGRTAWLPRGRIGRNRLRPVGHTAPPWATVVPQGIRKVRACWMNGSCGQIQVAYIGTNIARKRARECLHNGGANEGDSDDDSI